MIATESNNISGLKKIDFEYLKKSKFNDYCDEDLFIVEDYNHIPDSITHDAYEIDTTLLIVCTKGEAQLTINERECTLHEGQIIITLPRTIYANCRPLTPDFQAKTVGVSLTSIESSSYINDDVWKTLSYVATNPVLNITEDEMLTLSHYYEIIKIKIRQNKPLFRREVMIPLIQSVRFELFSIAYRHSLAWDEQPSNMSQGDVLFKRFVMLLGESDGRIRSVAQFAEKLCITPKYLSTVVKSISGQTALEMIHRHATRVIVRELKYTDKTIKEIANELDFPSLSFFGKFVRAQLGVSPKKFRNNYRKI